MARERASRYCTGVNKDGTPCVNDARVGKDTCRWHDEEVLALRKQADELLAKALRLAKA
jgi:hypothetical protein